MSSSTGKSGLAEELPSEGLFGLLFRVWGLGFRV